jgi:hypothetical protein
MLLVVASACGGGSVARYAPCNPTDTCPSRTVCESPTLTGEGDAPVCTYSCMGGDATCPADSSGTPGVCVQPTDATDSSSWGYCLQSCTAGECPAGEVCTMANTFSLDSSSEPTQVCIPQSSDPLSGTSWTSSSVAATATQNGVTSSTYAVTFGMGTISASVGTDVVLSGTFTATFTQLYTIGQYAGCMETTTFTGGTWTDVTTVGLAGEGSVGISAAMGTTNRTSCQLPDADLTNQTGLYDSAVDAMNGTAFMLSTDGTTLTFSQSTGATPYVDGSSYTFTKVAKMGQ